MASVDQVSDLVTVDSRGRISLGRFGVQPNAYYMAYLNENSGKITLVPATVTTNEPIPAPMEEES